MTRWYASIAAPQWLCRLLVMALLAAALPLPVLAQSAPASPPPSAAPAPVSAQELERLVSALQDDAQRARLVEQLKGLIAAQRGAEVTEPAAPATLLEEISARIDALSGEVVAAAAVIVDAPRLVAWVEYQVREPETRGFWLEVFLKLGVIFGFALFAEWALRTLLRQPRRRLATGVAEHVVWRIVLMVVRGLLDALPILAFAGIAYVVLPLTSPRFGTERVATTLVGAYVTTRIIAALARIVLLPRQSAGLFAYWSEETRFYLFVWIKRFTYVAVYAYAIAAGAWWLGIPGGIYALFLKAAALVLATLAIIFVLQNRAAVADWLRGRALDDGDAGAAGGGEASSWRVVRARLADTWHILAILYIVGIFLVDVLRIEGGFVFVLRATLLTIALFFAARFAVSLVRRTARRGFAIGDDLKQRYPTLETRANRYLPAITFVSALVIYAFAALAVLQAWNIESFSWFGSDFGRRLTGSLIGIGSILLVALIVWEIFSSAIERYLSGVDSRGVPVARSARARTLLPLVRTSVLVVLIVFVALIVLSELGLNIAPLLAGAGVVGLAIGFGSQALVKDVITGLFILIEDTLAVGDVVDVGKGHAGVVEAISIRTIRIRDGAGTLHAVPFSEVTSVNNLTKDYAYHVASIALSYREDVDRVSQVLREIGAELMKDAAFRPFILEPLEIIGIDKMNELGLFLQARIKTLPRKQWAIGYEFARRVRQEFSRRGIEQPYAVKPNYLADLAAAAAAAEENVPRAPAKAKTA
jgi:small conductance mechanosensitive channel